MKTTIFLQKSLLDQVETLARKMKVSRNRLFVLALEDYIHRKQSQELLAKINVAYADEPDAAEKAHCYKVKRHQRKIVEDTW